MTERELVCLATFPTPEDAAVLQAALEAEGVPNYLDNNHAIGLQWQLGNALGWVKVLVSDEDAEHAQALLQQRKLTTSGQSWVCECGAEVDAGFEICWQCGSIRPEMQEIAASHPPEIVVADDDAVIEVDRAWRAAILGCLFLPIILHVYSIILLLRNLNRQLDSKRTRRFYTAWVIDLSVIALAAWSFR